MADKEKQIEEMKDSIICAAIVTRVKIDDRSATNLTAFAEEIYAAGYRKQSDTINECIEWLKDHAHYDEEWSLVDAFCECFQEYE